MFDFIKSNKTIFGYIFAGLFIIILMFGIMFFLGLRTAEEEQTGDTFPVATERPDTVSTDDTFGPTDAERWVGEESANETAPFFRAITEIPVAKGVTFINKTNGNMSPFVRYIALHDGNIYQTPLDTLGDEEVLSNEKVQRIGDVAWSDTANQLLLRYYGDENTVVQSRFGMFTTENGTLTYNGKQFLENTQSVAFSPDGTELFYLIKTENGTTGYIESVKTGERAEVWNSVFTGLTVSWDSPNMVLIHTNPSSFAKGVVWLLNPNTFEYTPILGEEYALAAKANKTGEKVLYSIQGEDSSLFSLRVLDVASGKVVTVPIETFVDKCAWGSTYYAYCAVPKRSSSGSFLEDWYMGIKHTNDAVWRIDTRNGNVKKLLDPEEETGVSFDVVNMHVSPQDEYLIFNSQVNAALWALRLTDE